MKNSLIVAFIATVTLVGGCQSVKQDVQQKLDEWIALAEAEVRWNEIPESRQRTGVTRFILGKNKDRYQAYGNCKPSSVLFYPHSKESIDSQKELFRFATQLGWQVADCDGGSDRERYQLAHKANKWALERWREAGRRLTDQQRADIFCGVDWDMRRYKQHNPGRPVDTDVLDFLKDNPLPNGWECGN